MHSFTAAATSGGRPLRGVYFVPGVMKPELLPSLLPSRTGTQIGHRILLPRSHVFLELKTGRLTITLHDLIWKLEKVIFLYRLGEGLVSDAMVSLKSLGFLFLRDAVTDFFFPVHTGIPYSKTF